MDVFFSALFIFEMNLFVWMVLFYCHSISLSAEIQDDWVMRSLSIMLLKVLH